MHFCICKLKEYFCERNNVPTYLLHVIIMMIGLDIVMEKKCCKRNCKPHVFLIEKYLDKKYPMTMEVII